MSSTSKKVVISIVCMLVLGMIGFAVKFFMSVETANVNTDTPVTNEAAVNATVGLDNTNVTTNDNTNTNAEPSGSAASNQPVTSTGVVFIKGYKTPSESYGILTNDGFEIGFGKYDSMREQFRPYVGDQITVIFSSICRTSNENCCRTLFTFCGTVDTFTPLEQ